MKQREKNKTLILIFLFRGKNIKRGKMKKTKFIHRPRTRKVFISSSRDIHAQITYLLNFLYEENIRKNSRKSQENKIRIAVVYFSCIIIILSKELNLIRNLWSWKLVRVLYNIIQQCIMRKCVYFGLWISSIQMFFFFILTQISNEMALMQVNFYNVRMYYCRFADLFLSKLLQSLL